MNGNPDRFRFCRPFRQRGAMLIHKLAVNPQGVRGYPSLVDKMPSARQASDPQPALAPLMHVGLSVARPMPAPTHARPCMNPIHSRREQVA